MRDPDLRNALHWEQDRAVALSCIRKPIEHDIMQAFYYFYYRWNINIV